MPVYRAAAGFLWIDLATCLYRRSDVVILHGLVAATEAVLCVTLCLGLYLPRRA